MVIPMSKKELVLERTKVTAEILEGIKVTAEVLERVKITAEVPETEGCL